MDNIVQRSGPSHRRSTEATVFSGTPLLGPERLTTSPQANSERSTPRSSRGSLALEVSGPQGTAVDANAQAEAPPPRPSKSYNRRDMGSDLKACWINYKERSKEIWNSTPNPRPINMLYNGVIDGIKTGMRLRARTNVKDKSFEKRKEAIDEIWMTAIQKSEEYCELNEPIKKLKEDYDMICAQIMEIRKDERGKVSENEIQKIEDKKNEINDKIEKIKEKTLQEMLKDARLIYTKHYALDRAEAIANKQWWRMVVMFGVEAVKRYMDDLIKDLIKAVLEDKW